MSKTSKKVLLSVVALAAAASSAYAEDVKKVKKVKEVKTTEETKVEHKHHHHHSDVKVTLGASLDSQLGSVDQPALYSNLYPQGTTVHVIPGRDMGLVNDTKVTVGVEGMSRGLKYGGKIILNADTSASKEGSTKSAQQTFVFVESMYGRLEAGSMNGATVTMTAVPTAAATGGAAQGDWTFWVNPVWLSTTGGVAERYLSNVFITSASLPTDYQPTNASGNPLLNNYANKLSYFSPVWMGAQLGVSYTPDSDVQGTAGSLIAASKTYMNAGQYPDADDVSDANGTVEFANYATALYGTPAQGFKNVLSGGLNYAGTFSNVDVKASLLAQSGKAKGFFADSTNGVAPRNDLSAYEAALSLGYMGWTLGGSYGDWGKSGQVTQLSSSGAINAVAEAAITSSYYYTALLGYEYGPLNATYQYFQSNRGGVQPGSGAGKNYQGGRDQLTSWSLGVDYKLAQGLMPYVEYTHFDFSQNRTILVATTTQVDNSGSVVLVGTKLFF